MEHKTGILEVLEGNSDIWQDPKPFTNMRLKYRRYAVTQRVLKNHGFHPLAEIPEVVLALAKVAEGIAVELRRRGN